MFVRSAHADEIDLALANPGWPEKLSITVTEHMMDNSCRGPDVTVKGKLDKATIDGWRKRSTLAAPIDVAVREVVAILVKDRPWAIQAPQRSSGQCKRWVRVAFVLEAKRWEVDVDYDAGLPPRMVTLLRFIGPYGRDLSTQSGVAIELATNGLTSTLVGLVKPSYTQLGKAIEELARDAATRNDFIGLSFAAQLSKPTIDSLLANMTACQAKTGCTFTFDPMAFCAALADPRLTSAARVLALPDDVAQSECMSNLAASPAGRALFFALARTGTKRSMMFATSLLTFFPTTNVPGFTVADLAGMPAQMIAAMPVHGMIPADYETAVLGARAKLGIVAAPVKRRADSVQAKKPKKPKDGELVSVQADGDPEMELLARDGGELVLHDETPKGWSSTFAGTIRAPSETPDHSAIKVHRLSPSWTVVFGTTYNFAVESAGTTSGTITVIDATTKRAVRSTPLVIMEQPGDMCYPCTGSPLTAGVSFTDLDTDGTLDLVISEVGDAYFGANERGRHPTVGPVRMFAWRWSGTTWDRIVDADLTRLLSTQSTKLVADAARATGARKKQLLQRARGFAPNDPEIVLELLALSTDAELDAWAQAVYDLLGAAKFQKALGGDVRLVGWKRRLCKKLPREHYEWEEIWGDREPPVLECPPP